MLKEYILPLLLLLLGTPPARANADIHLPEAIRIHEGDRSGVLTIKSSEKHDVTVALSILAANTAAGTTGAQSLASYLQLPESGFVLRAGETRSVAIDVALPGKMDQGEYSARVRVVCRPVGESESAQIERFVRILFRKGDVFADIKLGNIGAVREEGEVRFTIGLIPLGNAAYRGNMQMIVMNEKGKTVHTIKQQIDVFETEQLTFALKSAVMPPGRYKIALNFDAERKDLGADAILVLPKKYTVEMKLP